LFKKISDGRAYEKIVNQIMQAILRGELKPKAKLPSEFELGKIFGVSRVTVREALRSLKQFGIIEIRQGSQGGSFIKEMNPEEIANQVANALLMTDVNISQLNEARMILEESILARMGNWKIDKDRLDDLEKNVKDAETFFRNKEVKERIWANFEFHTIIAEMTQNPILIFMHKIIIKMISNFYEQVRPSNLMVERTIVEHKEIVELLQRKQFEQAKGLSSKHLSSMGSLIIEKSKRQSVLGKK
jgi:GntR family transcriptional regulator, transcriptional repressor for pyruvate dehydrogenase complex